ncbi:MAG: hypothetical protein ACO3JG_12070 [Luteolibacter sp.]
MIKYNYVAIYAILALGSLAGCNKPHAGPQRSTGQSLGSAAVPAGVDTEALIQDLTQNDFELVDGKTFEQTVPAETKSRGFEGLVAARDTTVKSPNEFVVGVGPDTVIWFQSHDESGKAIAEWNAHVQKRIALIERLAGKKQ